MKRLPLMIAILCIATFAFSQATKQTIKTTGNIRYWEYLPSDFATRTKVPLVIFLTGIGQQGDTEADMTKIITLKNVPSYYVEHGTEFPFILISPQLKTNYTAWLNKYIDEVVEYVKAQYPTQIDLNNIYLTGLSLGGGGTWGYGQDPVYGDKLRGIIPVCGSQNDNAKACNIVTNNERVWAFHGDSDGTVPYSKSVNEIKAINACIPAPNPLAVLTTYTGVDHNSWERAYSLDHSYQNPNVYEWMAQTCNQPPVANAGPDQAFQTAITTVTLSGATSTDVDGSVSKYVWSQTAGTTVTINNTASQTPNVTGLTDGTYSFSLKVYDNNGLVSKTADDVTVVVGSGTTPPPTGNVAPVANAGPDKLIKLPTYTCTLFGSATDSDGTISSYKWTQLSGASCTISNTTIAQPKVTNLATGSYSFRLTVTDNSGATSTDDVIVVASYPPVATACADQTITLPINKVTLTSTGSDPDGTVAGFQWVKVSGPTGSSLTSYKASTSDLVSLVQGTYLYRVVVTDNAGVTSTDTTKITVLPATTTARLSASDTIGYANGKIVEPKIYDVLIYSDQGHIIYQGKNYSTLFSDIMVEKKLYFVHYYNNGKLVNRMKIVFTR